MASSDPKQGGDLFDMAKDGTSIPGDAGKMNLIPSVPRPDQIATDDETGAINYGGAADNATDISRVKSINTCSLRLPTRLFFPSLPPVLESHTRAIRRR